MNKKEKQKKFLELKNKMKSLEEDIEGEDEQDIKKEEKSSQKPSNAKNKGLFDRLWNKKKLEKPTYVAVIYLRNNDNAEPTELESKNGFFTYNGKRYHEREDCKYTLIKGRERIPLAIIHEDGVIPEGTKRWHHLGIEKKFRELQDQVINAIKYAELVKSGNIKEGGKMDPKTIVILVICLIIGGAFLANYF